MTLHQAKVGKQECRSITATKIFCKIYSLSMNIRIHFPKCPIFFSLLSLKKKKSYFNEYLVAKSVDVGNGELQIKLLILAIEIFIIQYEAELFVRILVLLYIFT